MAVIHKLRARKFLVVGPISGVGHCPRGVGGLPNNEPVVTISVGEYTVILTVREYRDTVQKLDAMLQNDK